MNSASLQSPGPRPHTGVSGQAHPWCLHLLPQEPIHRGRCVCTDTNTLPDQRPRDLKTGQPQGKRHGFRALEVAGAVSACTWRLPLWSAGRGESGRAEPSAHPGPAGKPPSNPLLALKGTSRTLQARPWEENSLARPLHTGSRSAFSCGWWPAGGPSVVFGLLLQT